MTTPLGSFVVESFNSLGRRVFRKYERALRYAATLDGATIDRYTKAGHWEPISTVFATGDVRKDW